jgi:putative transposase
MKKSRYSDEQIVRILREADKAPIAEVGKRHGVSEQSIYSWRKRFGEINTDDVRSLKGAGAGKRPAQEAAGRARSRNRSHEGDHAKKMVSAPARRIAALYAVERGIPQRRWVFRSNVTAHSGRT